MRIRWVTAFVDIAADRFDAGVSFWEDATETQRSWPRGSHDEFATLVPADGDPYLRVQRTGDASCGVHLDFHVVSVGATRDVAIDRGATLISDGGHATLRSPAGLRFCIVAEHGEATVPAPLADPARHRLDQVSIDVPPESYARECDFWSSFTGWPLVSSQLPEFSSLQRPSGIALRLLLQRLDTDDGSGARAHLDIACGSQIDAVARHHEALGAIRLGPTKLWLRMQDPAGLPYCLTPRDPGVEPGG